MLLKLSFFVIFRLPEIFSKSVNQSHIETFQKGAELQSLKKKTIKFPQVYAVMEFQSSSGIKLTYKLELHGMGFCS